MKTNLAFYEDQLFFAQASLNLACIQSYSFVIVRKLTCKVARVMSTNTTGSFLHIVSFPKAV